MRTRHGCGSGLPGSVTSGWHAWAKTPGVALCAMIMGLMLATGGCGNNASPTGGGAGGTAAEGSSGPGQSADASPAAARQTTARIVAHSPALAVTLARMGYSDRIVGRHAHDVILPKSVPSCGEMGTIDYEALLNAKPTHVFIQWGSQALPPKLIDLAERNRWVLVNYDLLTLDQVLDSAEDMVRRLREHEADRQEAGLTRESRESLAGTAGVRARTSRAWAPKPWQPERAGRVLLLGSIDPPVAIGPGSFHHQMLVSMGATPAITEGTPWIPMDVEDVVRLDPDAILIFSPAVSVEGAAGAEGSASLAATSAQSATPPVPAAKPRLVDALRGEMFDELKGRLGRLGTSSAKAVTNGRVALIDDPLCMIPALSLADVADEMSKVLAMWAWPQGLPEEFRDVMPEDEMGGRSPLRREPIESVPAPQEP